MKKQFSFLIFLFVLIINPQLDAQDDNSTALLRQPTVSAEHIVFVYAGDLWRVDRDGSNPLRLTSSPAEENNPFLSPDGQHIAFSANYEGNTDVYVISINGGQPQRLTWHPGADIVTGWSADGSEVAFFSTRENNHGRSGQLYHVDKEGGAPLKQMEARFFRGQWNADGNQLAYIDFGPAYNGLYGGSAGWRGYRGGTSPSVKIFDKAENSITEIPGERINDIQPFWLAGMVYFISDRHDKRLNMHRFDPATAEIDQLTDKQNWDILWAAGHENKIVYAAGGRLHELDINTGEIQPINIHLNPDLPQLRTEWKTVGGNIQSVSLSPNGKRVLATARGEVFSIPVDDGSTRNLSKSDGVREYTAIWSPAGGEIAWIVESLTGQELQIIGQDGLGEKQSFELGPDFYQLRLWDADNGRIIFSDNRQAIHYIDLNSGEVISIDQSDRQGGFSLALSQDGKWLAYTLMQPNYFRDLMLYDFENAENHLVSNSMADVASPAFCRDGKFLYFAASTNTGPRQFSLDMTSQERPYRAGIYALVLQKDGESPLALRKGNEEESDKEDNDENNGDEKVKLQIDLEDLFLRKIALPISKGNYGNLNVAHDGALIFQRSVQAGASVNAPGESSAEENKLMRFDFKDRKAEVIHTGLINYDISHSGKQLLMRQVRGGLATADVGKSLTLKPLNTSDLRMRIDPKKEWRQIFDEGWRMQRDFFYAENLHGLDWEAVYEQYLPLLDHVARRECLNDLMVEMIAELHAGHNRVGGGDVHRESGPSGGLLGADFTIENNRWQISKIYTGESWNPFLSAPLAVPGNAAKEGEYIIAVNGQELTAEGNLFKKLENTVGKQVVLTLSEQADGNSSRNITVEPIGWEFQLRLWNWIESNRQAVAEATDGRVGYIYLPNTAGAGYTLFNRMFYAQLDKEALIIDERSNGGGQAADYIVEVLSRPHLSNWVYRRGMMSTTPFGSLHGPKIMMIDQDAGSGGDYLPYAFRELGIGKLLGTRTWGGLIGIFANPAFVDGGVMTVPHFRFVDTDNNWSVENEGVAPDIEVKLDPIATNEGKDTQLEKAIEEILQQLENYSDDIPREKPPLPTELGK
ncbi:MAG: peptidase S41 [Saprospirales bacterium]|nr:MAG: peptidase S41 [Saprospirales bacterium]